MLGWSEQGPELMPRVIGPWKEQGGPEVQTERCPKEREEVPQDLRRVCLEIKDVCSRDKSGREKGILLGEHFSLVNLAGRKLISIGKV